MTDVFISCVSRLRPRVEAIASALSGLGLDVWINASEPEGDYPDDAATHLRKARCVLVCWSDNALAHGGDSESWVRGEAEFGLEAGTLVAVMLDDTELDPPWDRWPAEDLIDWTPKSDDRAAWQRMLDAIGAKVGRPGLGAYDRARQAGTSEALSAWAREHDGDMLAVVAKAEAKALYLREAAAASEARQAAKVEAERQAKLEAQWEQDEQIRLRGEAEMRAREIGARQRASEKRDDVLSVPRGEPQDMRAWSISPLRLVAYGVGGVFLMLALLVVARLIGIV